ncbi:hypothetical protein ACWO25_004549 [Vibrio parahaemolyticus]
MLVNTIELVRKVKRWWGRFMMKMELYLSFATLVMSVLLVITLPFSDVTLEKLMISGGLLSFGILQWRWRAAIWSSIRKHQRTLEQTDFSA